ncbi:Hypothetical protein CINCED_3A011427 [Cinara cedri]|uniref:Uncharacterized protein n=1 Tax=Cinara cedri TaxID=506608 RepID=A0A5E4NAS6_9HEMI|nr:Hypothetical protein CINCED_3A011427 [Cinara cedri]
MTTTVSTLKLFIVTGESPRQLFSRRPDRRTFPGKSALRMPSTSTWTADGENDALFMNVCQAIDDTEGYDNEGRKRTREEKTAAGVKKKKARIEELVKTPGFTEIGSSFDRIV